jgi:transcriptional regulator with XRE-family HTH domain
MREPAEYRNDELKRWREQNGCSQSDAVRVLTNAGIPVTLDSLQNWESGRRRPRADVALALADFLRQDPTVPKKSARHAGANYGTVASKARVSATTRSVNFGSRTSAEPSIGWPPSS